MRHEVALVAVCGGAPPRRPPKATPGQSTRAPRWWRSTRKPIASDLTVDPARHTSPTRPLPRLTSAPAQRSVGLRQSGGRRGGRQDLKLRDDTDLRAAMRDPSLVFEATAVSHQPQQDPPALSPSLPATVLMPPRIPADTVSTAPSSTFSSNLIRELTTAQYSPLQLLLLGRLLHALLSLSHSSTDCHPAHLPSSKPLAAEVCREEG